MKNKITSTEKLESKCPAHCRDCEFYEGDFSCTANDCHEITYEFSNPRCRPLPMPLNCPWWYMNEIYQNVSNDKKQEYIEERLHLFAAEIYLKSLDDFQERKAFIDHWFRPGGGSLIDFNIYPQCKSIYDDIASREKAK